MHHSQNYVFRATDQYRFRASISSVFCRTGICLYKIEYLMNHDGWSSPHINTGLQYVDKNVLFQNMEMSSTKMILIETIDYSRHF